MSHLLSLNAFIHSSCDKRPISFRLVGSAVHFLSLTKGNLCTWSLPSGHTPKYFAPYWAYLFAWISRMGRIIGEYIPRKCIAQGAYSPPRQWNLPLAHVYLPGLLEKFEYVNGNTERRGFKKAKFQNLIHCVDVQAGLSWYFDIASFSSASSFMV